MNDTGKSNNKEKNKNGLKEKLNQNVVCPYCGLSTTIILDYKKIEEKKSDWLCLLCGHIFEYESKD